MGVKVINEREIEKAIDLLKDDDSWVGRIFRYIHSNILYKELYACGKPSKNDAVLCLTACTGMCKELIARWLKNKKTKSSSYFDWVRNERLKLINDDNKDDIDNYLIDKLGMLEYAFDDILNGKYEKDFNLDVKAILQK